MLEGIEQLWHLREGTSWAMKLVDRTACMDQDGTLWAKELGPLYNFQGL